MKLTSAEGKQMDKRPTIIDVARHAGVSKSTVSLVLQNSPLVKSETRKKVEASIKATNYVYNRSAANLGGAGTDLIGLVINDLRNPFFTEFATSAQMSFSKHGYATVIANTDEDPNIQSQVIASMLEHDVSALLISPCYGGDAAIFEDVSRSRKPLMQVLRCIDARTDQFPFFSIDYEKGGRLATEHLLGLGTRRIAFVGGVEDGPITQERMSGYRQVMAEYGLETIAFHGRATRLMGRDIAQKLAHDHPEIEAVLCFNDLVGLGMISGFAETPVKVGSDILLVGFDDIEECQQTHPQLSSVRCDVNKFGQTAAEYILNWLNTDIAPQTLPRAAVQLIARQSSLGHSC